MQQQDIARCSQFLLAMDQAVMAETSQLDDLFGLEEAVLASAPLVEELLCQILLPVDGGERLSLLQARDVRLDQRLDVLFAQIRLNRLDQIMGAVMVVYFDLMAAHLARAMAEIGKLEGRDDASLPSPV